MTSLGIAFGRGGACNDHKSVAVIRDFLTFQGVSTAAHELGHLFGARHDFETECEEDVPVPDYMMGYTFNSSNQFRWSACSLNDMADFFKSNQALCLKNEPVAIRSPYKKFLPGKIADVDAQCENMFPGSKAALNTGESVCHRLVCQKITITQNGTQITTLKPAENSGFGKGATEGSSCENGGICIQGDCIPPKS